MYIFLVLLESTAPVCMKYIAQDESQVANILWLEVKLSGICTYLLENSLIKSCILSYKYSGCVLCALLYCILQLLSCQHNTVSWSH